MSAKDDPIEMLREKNKLALQVQNQKALQSKEAKAETLKETTSLKTAKIGTKVGQEHTNVYDAQAGLVGFLKDTNKINTTNAKNYSKIQERNNQQIKDTISRLSDSPSKYQIKDSKTGEYRPVIGKDIDDLKQSLEVGEINLVLLNKAAKTGEANKAKYIETIKKLNEQSIKPMLKKAYTYKSQAQRYIKEHTTTEIPEPKTTLQRRSEAQKGFISDLIKADIKDPKQAGKLIKEISPYYAQTVDVNPGAGDKFVKELDTKIRNYEKIADYQTPLGIDELTGSNKKQNINKLKARIAHMTLSHNKAAISAALVTGLGVSGGPVTVGLVAAIGTASMLNPDNRKILDEYVRAHPQEFMASIGGAIMAGVSVNAARSIYKQYRVDMTLAQQKKYDKMINDYAYLEQNKGAEFPSRAIEIPERYKNQIIVSDPVDPEKVIFENMIHASMNERDAAHLIEFISKSKTTFYYDGGGNRFDLLTVDKLLDKFPELKDPYFNPAFKDPNILGKADLVARNPQGTAFTPLLAAALLQLSKQGYITRDQIEELIKLNKLNIQALKREGIEIPSDFTEATLKDLSLPAIAELSKLKQEQILELDPLLIQALIVEPVEVPEVPEPTDPAKTTPPLILSDADKKKRKDMHLSLFRGRVRLYRVKYQYRGDETETIGPLEARSLDNALSQAQRKRRPHKTLPSVIDVELIGEREQ